MDNKEKIANLLYNYYHFCEACIFNFDGCSWEQARKCEYTKEKILKRIKELQNDT